MRAIAGLVSSAICTTRSVEPASPAGTTGVTSSRTVPERFSDRSSAPVAAIRPKVSTDPTRPERRATVHPAVGA